LLVRCEYSNVTMADGGEEYPDLEQRLSETAVMMNRSMEYEADNILSFMQEMGLLDSEDFETQVSTSEVQVRRADSVVVSLLADSFAEYPELFNEKYMSVPQAYMVELPMDSSFFADLDADGTLEELNCTGFNDDVGSGYTDFGLYTDTDGYYHYEECFAYDFNPYYVKTADGNHYLYVFREESDVENRQMVLMVYNVTGAKFAKVGEMNVAPQYLGEDAFVLPLDPDSMWLVGPDDDSTHEYYVGDSGMPVKHIR